MFFLMFLIYVPPIHVLDVVVVDDDDDDDDYNDTSKWLTQA